MTELRHPHVAHVTSTHSCSRYAVHDSKSQCGMSLDYLPCLLPSPQKVSCMKQRHKAYSPGIEQIICLAQSGEKR